MVKITKYHALNLKTGKREDIKSDDKGEWFIVHGDNPPINVKSVGFYNNYSIHDSKTNELVF